MTLKLQPVRVATGFEEEGMLVMADERLLAVLVRLSDENEVAPGEWYLEAGFGHYFDGPDHPLFRTLDEAQDWIAERLAKRAQSAAAAQS
jgi:hypothetical protein